MKKYLSVLMIVAVAFGIKASFIHAENNFGGRQGRPHDGIFGEERQQNREDRHDLTTEIQNQRDALHQENQGDREVMRNEIKDNREKMRDEHRREIEALKNNPDTTPAEVQALREKIKIEREAFDTEAKTERENFHKELESKKEAFKQLNDEKKNELRDNARQMSEERFSMVISKIKALQTKIADKVATAKAHGADVTTAEIALADATIQIAHAEATKAELQALLPTDGSKITADIYSQIKEKANAVKIDLKTARQDLKEAVKSIRQFFEQKHTDAETTIPPTGEQATPSDNGATE